MKTKTPKSLILLILLLFFSFFSIVRSQSITPIESRKILYINSYNTGLDWSDSITSGIVQTLKAEEISLFTEYLDGKRFKKKNFELTAEIIKRKYESFQFDAVIVSDNDALDFVFHYGDSLFPSIPVVYCGISNPSEYKFENSRFYGFLENPDANHTLSTITKVFPDAHRLLMLIDNTTTGLDYKHSYKTYSKNYPGLQLIFSDEMAMDSIIKTVKNGNEFDAILLVCMYRDKSGNTVDFVTFQKQIAAISNKPVFAHGNVSIGFGIIAGFANLGSDQGINSAQLAIKFIKNPNLKNTAHVNRIEEKIYLDYNVLEKYNVPQKNIPPNAIIVNKPVFKYWRIIIILSIISFLLLSIIFVLSINIKKRIDAEKTIQKQIVEIQNQNTELEESFQESEELNNELEETNRKLYDSNQLLQVALQKAEESERLKSSFLANMSHEIRTPLNAIVGFSTLLIDAPADSDNRQTYVNFINTNNLALLQLIDDILDLSKIEAGQLNIQLDIINIPDIFEEMHQQLLLQNKNNIDIRIVTDSNLKNQTLYTDKIRIKQIFTNLLNNALKFTDSGFIELGYRIDNPNEITFYVSDSGIGIKEEFQESIFDHFTKVENINKLYSGTGLGLAISKRLVELLGGKIWLESKIEVGSTFYFTHPLVS